MLRARHVPLKGQPNLRDLGGYETTDGRMVKHGRLYRSGELSRLSDADLSTLAGLGIRTVVDFRSASEVEARGADRVPEGARYLPLRIDHGDLGPVLTRALTTGDVSEMPSHVLAHATRSIVRDASEQYGALFDALEGEDHLPLVFHCTHGKDRAGVAAAVLLMALGVPSETACADYLLSNEYRRAENTRELARLRSGLATTQGIALADVDLSRLEELFWLQGSYFDAMLSEIESRHGSFERYLENGLGVSPKRRNAMRDRFTEPCPC